MASYIWTVTCSEHFEISSLIFWYLATNGNITCNQKLEFLGLAFCKERQFLHTHNFDLACVLFIRVSDTIWINKGAYGSTILFYINNAQSKVIIPWYFYALIKHLLFLMNISAKEKHLPVMLFAIMYKSSAKNGRYSSCHFNIQLLFSFLPPGWFWHWIWSHACWNQ